MDLSIPKENIELTEVQKLTERKNVSVILEFMWIIVVAVIGLVVYKATGLYDAVSSDIGHVIVGGGIIYCYLIAFRRGLYWT